MTDQELYETAADALDDIINSRDATPAQKKAATDKREDLTINFIGKVKDRIESRTAQFQQFINKMQELIKQFDPATTIAGIVKLQGVVDEAAKLVKAATTDTAATRAAPATRGGPVITETPPVAPKSVKGAVNGAAKFAKRAAKAKPPAIKRTTKAGVKTRKPAGKKPSAKKRASARKPVKKAAATKSTAKKPAAKRGG